MLFTLACQQLYLPMFFLLFCYFFPLLFGLDVCRYRTSNVKEQCYLYVQSWYQEHGVPESRRLPWVEGNWFDPTLERGTVPLTGVPSSAAEFRDVVGYDLSGVSFLDDAPSRVFCNKEAAGGGCATMGPRERYQRYVRHYQHPRSTEGIGLRAFPLWTRPRLPGFTLREDSYLATARARVPEPELELELDEGGVARPVEPEATDLFPWFADLRAAIPLFREEFLALDAASAAFSIDGQGLSEFNFWKLFQLQFNGRVCEDNLARVPRSARRLREISERHALRLFDMSLGLATISVLEPGTHIMAHHGPTNFRMRCHVTLLHAPGAKMRVGAENVTWEPGGVFCFDDSFEHEVWHEGDERRVILLFDLWHPDLRAEQIDVFLDSLFRRNVDPESGCHPIREPHFLIDSLLYLYNGVVRKFFPDLPVGYF